MGVTVARVSEPSAPAPAQPERQGSARVVFEGNRDLTRDDLLEVMRTDDVDAGPYDPDVLERDLLLIAAAYYDHGYVNVKVGEPIVVTAKDGTVDIRIPISEGVRFRIGKLEIDERDANGASVPPLGGIPLRERLRPRDGDWFSRKVLIEDLSAIRRLYHDEGYGSVEADPETELDPQHATMDVTIPVHRGPLVTIDHVNVVGDAGIPVDRLRRAIRIADGSPYGETKLDEARARVVALGVDVWVSTESNPSTTSWTVTFEVQARHP